MKNNILVVGPKTKGGITKVIENFQEGGLSDYPNIKFHPSTYDAEGIMKIYSFLVQYIKAIWIMFRFKPDILHIHFSFRGSFWRKSFYIYLSKMFKKKSIIHVHPAYFVDYIKNSSGMRRRYFLSTINMSDMIITLTKDVKREIRGFTNYKKRIVVLHNPINTREYTYNSIENREKNTLFFLGWIIPKKGIFDLLPAAPQAKKKIKNLKIIICGNKETNRLREMAREQGLEDYVEINDWVESEEKIRLLRKCTALILPSYTEGIPNVILEAMACGTPILATPVGGNPEVMKDNINCLYFPPGDTREMAKKITELFQNRALQKKISTNNIRDIQKYDVKNMVQELLQIYSLLGRESEQEAFELNQSNS